MYELDPVDDSIEQNHVEEQHDKDYYTGDDLLE